MKVFEVTIAKAITYVYPDKIGKKFTVPEGIKEIKLDAFDMCDELEEIVLPSTLIRIEGAIFQNCQNLKKITISKDNPIYSDCDCNVIFDKKNKSLLQGCSTSTIPNETEILKKACFKGFTLENNNIILENVKIINREAFAYTNLNSIKLNEGLENIGADAFAGCNIKTLALPSTVTTLSANVFNSMYNLNEIIITGELDSNMLSQICIHESIKNIYVTNIDKDSSFYKFHKNQIKLMSLDNLLENKKSFKEINKIYKEYKGQEKTR